MSVVKLRIVTGLKEVEGQEGGKYTVQVDIVQKGDADGTAKQREKEGYSVTSAKHLTINGGVSPTLEVKEKATVSCDVTGALKPFKPFLKGQNELEVNKKSSSRHFVLTHNEDDTSGSAEVTFTSDTKFLHQVNIHGVRIPCSSGYTEKGHPLMESQSSLEQGARATQVTSGAGSVGSNKLHAEPCSDGEVGSMDRQFGKLKMAEVHPMVRGETREPPEPPLEASFQGDTAHDKILSDKSLKALATNLPPSDATLLFVGLGLSQADIKREREHHRNLIVWQISMLCMWRAQNIKQGMTVDKLVASLLSELKDIRRNDIAYRIEMTLQENRELCDDDLNR